MTISAYRTVTWRPSLAGQLAAPPLAWPNKMPADVADFTLDIGLYLANPVDTVASCSVFTLAAGMTFSAVAVAGGLLTTTISGGGLGLTYPVDFVVVTAGGQTIDFRVLMPIGPGASRTQATYVPSIATATTPGLVRPGNNVTISPDGAISFTGGGSSLPATGGLLATTGTAGVAGAATAAQVGAASVIATGGSTSRTLADRFATTFNVLDHGAVADNSTDLAIALRTIAGLITSQSASKIIIPAGYWAWKTAVTFTGAVIIEGQGYSAVAAPGNGTTGTWITISGTSGYTPLTFTGTNARGSILRDLAFTQVQPTPTGGSWTPSAYDFVVRAQDCLGEVTIDNVLMSGVTKGVYADNSGRLRIKALYGQFFQNAVTLGHSYDVSRIDHLHSWPYWSVDARVLTYTRQNLNTVTTKRVDGLFIGDLFSFAHLAAVYVTSDTTGTTGTMRRGYISNLYSDVSTYAIFVDASNADFQISNLTHQGNDPTAGGYSPISGGSGIVVTGSSNQIQVSNYYSEVTGSNSVVVQGAGNALAFSNFGASQYGTAGAGLPAINVTTNATFNSVTLANPARLLGTAPLVLFNAPAVANLSRNVQIIDAGGAGGNEIRTYTGASGSGVATMSAAGGDANIGVDIRPVGAPGASVRLLASSGTPILRTDDSNNANGAVSLLVRPTTSAIQFYTEGYSTVSGFTFFPTGGADFETVSLMKAQSYTLSTANLLTIAGGAAGTGTSITASGVDPSINVKLTAKGPSGSVFLQGGYGYGVLRVDDFNNTSGATSLLVRPGTTEVQIVGEGTAANFDIDFYPKGTGVLKVNGVAVPMTSGSGTVTSVVGGTGLAGGTITTTGTLSVSYGTTAGTAAQGNDSRITSALSTSAAANTYLALSGGTLTGALSGTTATMTGAIQGTTLTGTTSVVASGTNSITLTGSATTVPVKITASGSDANISVSILTKGVGSFSAGVSNTSSSAGAFAIGNSNSVTGGASFSAGALGFQNTVSAQLSYTMGTQNSVGASGAVVIGSNNTNTNNANFIFGGGSSASGNFSVLMGVNANDRGRYGVLSFAGGQFAAAGDALIATQILRVSTAATSSARLTADAAAAGTTNVVNIPNNTAYTIKTLTITGRDTTTGDAATWYLPTPSLILRKASAATTTLPTAITLVAGPNSGGGSVLAMTAPTVVADTSNGGLNVSLTPAAANLSHWVCEVTTVEVQ